MIHKANTRELRNDTQSKHARTNKYKSNINVTQEPQIGGTRLKSTLQLYFYIFNCTLQLN